MTEQKPNTDVFHQLAEEVKHTQEHLDELDSAVKSFVRLNGSGDGIRKRLRKKLKKATLLKACESYVRIC